MPGEAAEQQDAKRRALHAQIAAALEGSAPATGPLTKDELLDIDQAIDILNPLLQRDIRRLMGELLAHRRVAASLAKADTERIEKPAHVALSGGLEPACRPATEGALEHG
jgi:hypothetical protein